MDFGIARLESSSLTQVGTVVGTPTHMSPEQLMGLQADGRADLWSSGVILYELLTGLSPFLAESPATVMHKVLQTDPQPPSAHTAALPKGFDNVVARALAKKADERFQTAREFQAAMLQALQGKLPAATSTAMRTQRSAAEETAARKAQVLAIDPAVLAEVERSLSRHVGPLAKILVKRTQGEAGSIGQFFRALAENIPDAEEHKAFMKKMDAVKANLPESKPAPEASAVAKTVPAGTQTGFTPEVLAAAEKRLASYVGPLARVLIKEAAGQSGNIKELYRQLALHIDEEDERRAFLASLPG
jgi:serine/threonine-protein kinase